MIDPRIEDTSYMPVQIVVLKFCSVKFSVARSLIPSPLIQNFVPCWLNMFEISFGRSLLFPKFQRNLIQVHDLYLCKDLTHIDKKLVVSVYVDFTKEIENCQTSPPRFLQNVPRHPQSHTQKWAIQRDWDWTNCDRDKQLIARTRRKQMHLHEILEYCIVCLIFFQMNICVLISWEPDGQDVLDPFWTPKNHDLGSKSACSQSVIKETRQPIPEVPYVGQLSRWIDLLEWYYANEKHTQNLDQTCDRCTHVCTSESSLEMSGPTRKLSKVGKIQKGCRSTLTQICTRSLTNLRAESKFQGVNHGEHPPCRRWDTPPKWFCWTFSMRRNCHFCHKYPQLFAVPGSPAPLSAKKKK